ncbi:SPOR domain-containing protein [Desulfurobacterium sp.]
MKRTGKAIFAALLLGLGIGTSVYAEPSPGHLNIKIKGYLYSYEIGKFKDKNRAFKFILNLPGNLRKSAYLYQKGNTYSVRVFLMSSPSALMKYRSELKDSNLPAKIVKTPDIFLYSVQLITTTKKESAERFYKKLPPEIKKEAFIYKTDSGYYTVRVFLAKTRKEAEKLQRKLRFLSIKTVVVPTSPTKLGLEKEQEKIKKTQRKSAPLQIPVIKAPETPGGKAEVIIQAVPPTTEEKKIRKVKLKRIQTPIVQSAENKTLSEFKMQKELKKIVLSSEKLIKGNKIKAARIKTSGEVVVPEKEPYKTGKIEFLSLFPLLDRTVNLYAQWQYNTEYKDGNRSSFFNENYNFNTPGEVTDGIKYLISVGYSKYHTDVDTWQSTFRPALNTRLINDLFNLSSSISLINTKTSSGYDGKNTNYELIFSSAWNPKYPYISAAVSKNSISSDNINSDTYSKRFSTGYTYKRNLSLGYSYTHSRTEDHVRNVFSETTNHNANISVRKAFFDGKIYLSAIESIYYSDNRYSLKSVNGYYYQKVSPITGLSGIDTSPSIGTLTPNALLTDGDYNTSSGVNLQTPYENIAINTDYQPVDLITLYIGGNLTATDISTFHWDLYTSSDGNVWNIVATNIPFTYDSQTETLNFVLPQMIEDNYIKLVLTSTGATNTGYVTEVEVYEKVANATTVINNSSTHGDTTRVGVRVKLPLNLGYSFQYERTGKDGKEISSKFSHNLSGMWRYRYIQIGAGAGRTDYFIKDQDTRSSQRANIDIKAKPLSTLSLRAGTGYIENFINYDKTSTSFIISTGINARIFTGLNAGLSSDIVKTTNEETNTSATSYNTKLNINARLFPSLLVSSSIQHNVSSTTTDIYSVSSTWTPSEILRLTVSKGYISREDDKNSSTTNISLSIVPRGGDIRYGLNMSSSNGKESYSGNIFWQVSEYLTANGYLRYTPSDNSISTGVTANARW